MDSSEHVWILVSGSNATFKCNKCGMLGTRPLHSDPLDRINIIKPLNKVDCNTAVVDYVMAR